MKFYLLLFILPAFIFSYGQQKNSSHPEHYIGINIKLFNIERRLKNFAPQNASMVTEMAYMNINSLFPFTARFCYGVDEYVKAGVSNTISEGMTEKSSCLYARAGWVYYVSKKRSFYNSLLLGVNRMKYDVNIDIPDGIGSSFSDKVLAEQQFYVLINEIMLKGQLSEQLHFFMNLDFGIVLNYSSPIRGFYNYSSHPLVVLGTGIGNSLFFSPSVGTFWKF